MRSNAASLLLKSVKAMMENRSHRKCRPRKLGEGAVGRTARIKSRVKRQVAPANWHAKLLVIKTQQRIACLHLLPSFATQGFGACGGYFYRSMLTVLPDLPSPSFSSFQALLIPRLLLRVLILDLRHRVNLPAIHLLLVLLPQLVPLERRRLIGEPSI